MAPERSDWFDVSPYVVHFTKAGGDLPPPPSDASNLSTTMREIADTPPSDLDRFMCILGDRWLYPGSKQFGSARLRKLGDSQCAVCFSEVPLGLLDRLVERYSDWGIGFPKGLVRKAGGGPVWYLHNRGAPAKAFRKLVTRELRNFDPESPLWDLTPLVDQPGEYEMGRYEFEWEREWRLPGPNGFDFAPHEIAFLFAPEGEHEGIRGFLDEAHSRGDAEDFTCPLVDASWERARIEEAVELHLGDA